MALLVRDISNEKYLLKRCGDCPSPDNQRKHVSVSYDTDEDDHDHHDICNTQWVELTLVHASFNFLIFSMKLQKNWNNSQATLHPMVIYYNSLTEIRHQRVCFISGHVTLDSVYHCVFQKIAIGSFKELLPNVKKVIYFSDRCGTLI